MCWEVFESQKILLNANVSGDGPLLVYFKLPVSEISEIDDHKSVSAIKYFLKS